MDINGNEAVRRGRAERLKTNPPRVWATGSAVWVFSHTEKPVATARLREQRAYPLRQKNKHRTDALCDSEGWRKAGARR